MRSLLYLYTRYFLKKKNLNKKKNVNTRIRKIVNCVITLSQWKLLMYSLIIWLFSAPRPKLPGQVLRFTHPPPISGPKSLIYILLYSLLYIARYSRVNSENLFAFLLICFKSNGNTFVFSHLSMKNFLSKTICHTKNNKYWQRYYFYMNDNK